MIAILTTACGCEKAINVDYSMPREIRVPLNRPVNFIAAEETDDDYMTTRVHLIRTFDFYKRRDDGIVEYRERIS
jgi:hypothetical protein